MGLSQHASTCARNFGHDASRDNPIGFEWILMSKIPGRSLVDVWRSMNFEANKQVSHQVAVHFSDMFKRQLRGIGNLYAVPKPQDVEDSDLPEVQRIVSMGFFWGDHILYPVPRGPFYSSKDWLEARLLCYENDCTSTLARVKEEQDPDKDDMNDVNIATSALFVISKLKSVLDDLFPPGQEGLPEPTILFHDDLARRNIMVDDAGVLTGVVDWECVSALPLWKACDFPSFLDGTPLVEPPVRAQYNFEENYWSDMLDYDTTRLKEYFLEEMRRLDPGWVKVFEASQRKRDFDLAVRHCTERCTMARICSWIDDVALGNADMDSLLDRVNNCTTPADAYLDWPLVPVRCPGPSVVPKRKKKEKVRSPFVVV